MLYLNKGYVSTNLSQADISHLNLASYIFFPCLPTTDSLSFFAQKEVETAEGLQLRRNVNWRVFPQARKTTQNLVTI